MTVIKPAQTGGYCAQGNIMKAAVNIVLVPKMVIPDTIVFLLPQLL